MEDVFAGPASSFWGSSLLGCDPASAHLIECGPPNEVSRSYRTNRLYQFVDTGGRWFTYMPNLREPNFGRLMAYVAILSEFEGRTKLNNDVS